MPAAFSLSTVHLSTARSWRGGENQILLLCKGLAQRGHQALILAPKDAPLHLRAHDAGIPTETLTLHNPLDPLGTVRLGKWLRRHKPDILHLHDSHAVLPGQVAARALPARRLSVFAHRRTAFALRSRWKYGGRIDKVIAISQAAKKQLLAAGIPEERVAVVFSGLEFPEPLRKDHPEAQALRNELGLAPEAFLVAHAAALTREKRQEDLLHAVAQSLQRSPIATPSTELHLAIAGKGEREEDLRALAQALGVAHRVHFMGFKHNLQPLWAVAEAACYTSETEGLCTALIEAQGVGLPAVVTRAGGMVEVVEDGATGSVVEIGDVPALLRALLRLAEDPELRARQGRAARQRACTLFAADGMTERILELYRCAVAQRDQAA